MSFPANKLVSGEHCKIVQDASSGMAWLEDMRYFLINRFVIHNLLYSFHFVFALKNNSNNKIIPFGPILNICLRNAGHACDN